MIFIADWKGRIFWSRGRFASSGARSTIKGVALPKRLFRAVVIEALRSGW